MVLCRSLCHKIGNLLSNHKWWKNGRKIFLILTKRSFPCMQKGWRPGRYQKPWRRSMALKPRKDLSLMSQTRFCPRLKIGKTGHWMRSIQSYILTLSTILSVTMEWSVNLPPMSFLGSMRKGRKRYLRFMLERMKAQNTGCLFWMSWKTGA